MIEETAACGIDTISAAAEIDLVEIQLEYLFLAELGFHRHGEDHFAQLATDIAVVVQIDVTRQLLGDGRGCPQPATIGQANDNCARQTIGIDAGMVIEAAVLHRDHRILHFVRNLVNRYPAPKTGA